MFISEVVKGGAAELDGRLMQGDQILSVDGEDARHASQEAVAAILKVSRTLAITSCCSGSVFHLKKVTFKKITAESDLTHTHTHTPVCPLVRSWSRPVGAGTSQSCFLGLVWRKSGKCLVVSTGVEPCSMVDSSLC